MAWELEEEEEEGVWGEGEGGGGGGLRLKVVAQGGVEQSQREEGKRRKYFLRTVTQKSSDT